MPRPLLMRSEDFAYHVCIRSNNKEWFYIPLDSCWKILCDSLAATSEKYGTEIHSLVLMSNHVHLIVSTPGKNIDRCMQYFISMATREIQLRTQRINHIFGARYKWSLLDSAYALAYVYKYVLRNPVRAGMCSSVEQYPFSSANFGVLTLPLVEGFSNYWRCIPKNFDERLSWLNQMSPKELEQLIERALRRYKFRFSKQTQFQSRLRQLRREYGVEPKDGLL